MKKTIYSIFVLALLSSCVDDSTIKVQNMLPKVVIKDVEWGKLPISGQIIPGQTSDPITINDHESFYDIRLPASFPVKFYIELNGDLVYVQTRKSYRLGSDDDIIISIEDTTKVFNPLIESEKQTTASTNIKDLSWRKL